VILLLVCRRKSHRFYRTLKVLLMMYLVLCFELGDSAFVRMCVFAGS
jgi:tryptophan synthase alpha subunit